MCKLKPSEFGAVMSAAVVSMTMATRTHAPQSSRFALGEKPTQNQIAALDITVFPDGTGLPFGRGNAIEGRGVYAVRCATCHGPAGEGTADYPQLVGGRGTLKTDRPILTVGSYWPYATTIWDYVHRAMPYDLPGSLTSNEMYAVTAHLLFLNGIIREDELLNQNTLPRVRMPNRNGFVRDARPDVKPR